ncbi:lysophospholipase L1-like esterase [Natranaerovirga hydrolytica]|uniref:Lysophospholipase L1-like esterase n=1 Tax=Natranaerovirga hydrolytica TaxID=680378 RepID=A0A4R1MNH3_9FIRM|nr:GDSL-type esterase/lipase family protein [Natranaerovirga hydrolytica]TCK92854.1 lysophospholipase L1-like esterase [Natranaerovirga hydrolytica]
MITTNIVSLGDSLTTGYGVNTTDNYINRLEKYLPKYYPSICWNISNISKNNMTTREGLHILKKHIKSLNPNIVIIMLGTNDVSLDKQIHRTLEEFEDNLKSMLELTHHINNRTGLNFCIPIPVLITPPCVIETKVTYNITNNRIHQYSHIIKTLASEYNCPCIDFYKTTYDFNNNEDLFQDDGIHLSTKGYDLLFDTFFSAFTKLINYEGLIKDRE